AERADHHETPASARRTYSDKHMALSDLVVAFTGASGSPYGVRLVEVLLRAGRTVHLTVSPAAAEVFDQELGRPLRLGEGEFDPNALLGPAAEGLDLARLRY